VTETTELAMHRQLKEFQATESSIQHSASPAPSAFCGQMVMAMYYVYATLSIQTSAAAPPSPFTYFFWFFFCFWVNQAIYPQRLCGGFILLPEMRHQHEKASEMS